MFRAHTRQHLARKDSKRKRARRTLTFEPLEARALLTLLGNDLFPPDSAWNQRVDNAPVAANSATLVASIGTSGRLHPDFGTIYEGAYIGIPFNVVSGNQPKVNVVIDAYPDESDLLPVPIPAGAVIEGDPLPSGQNTGDRHLLVYDEDNNVVYELFNAHRPSETGDGLWHADSEAVWDLGVNSFRTPGHTSADAAGLPILPGLVRPDEVLDQGAIHHALRFTVPRSRNAYVYPASHHAGVNNASYPRMGERFRLKQSFDISGFSAANQVILQALKDYGMIVADNGSSWYLSGEPSSRWDDDDLHDLVAVLGSNFEAVDLRPIVTSLGQSSGSTSGGTQVTVVGQNFSGAAGMLQVRFGTTPTTNVSVLSDTMVVATSPAHAAGTVNVTVASPYGVSATSRPFTYAAGSSVVATRLFYKGSPQWNVTNANLPGFSDDNAIASDKSAYLPGAGTSTFANVSSYTRGINGLMVDLAGSHGSITAADFIFKFGNNNSPANWAAAPAPAVTVRPTVGTGGADRVELVWADGDIRNSWLQVVVRGNDALGGSNTNTALASSYVFYFGSAPADSGAGDTTGYLVNSADEVSARNDPHSIANPAALTNVNDHNRDGQVNSADQIATRNYATSIVNQLKFLSIGTGGPFAAEGFLTSRSVMDRTAVSPGVNLFRAADVRAAVAVALAIGGFPDTSTARFPVASPPAPGRVEVAARRQYFHDLAQGDRGVPEEIRVELVDTATLTEPVDGPSCPLDADWEGGAAREAEAARKWLPAHPG